MWSNPDLNIPVPPKVAYGLKDVGDWCLICSICDWAGEVNTACPPGCPDCGKCLIVIRKTEQNRVVDAQ